MQGYLCEKKTKKTFLNAYKKYWFVMDNEKIQKYKNIDNDPVETIYFRNINFINISESMNDGKKFFSLYYHDGTAKNFYQDGPVDIGQWVNEIRNILQKISYDNIKKKFDWIHIISDSCIIVDEIFNIIDYNAECEKLFIYLKPEVMNKNINTIIPDFQNKFYDELFSDKKKRVSKISKKMLVSNKNTTKIPVSVTINEYMPTDILKKFYIFIFRNINDNGSGIQNRYSININDLFHRINEHNDTIKNLIATHYDKIEDNNQIYEKKINVLEEENKSLLNINAEHILCIMELRNSLNYYKRKSGKATLINILSHESCRKIFREFCRENNSLENILFYEDVSRFKEKYIDCSNIGQNMEQFKDMKDDVDYIYNKYISVNGNNQINISNKLKSDITFMKDNQKDLYIIYDKAMYDVLESINNDIYPVFCSTQAGRRAISLFN